MAHKFYAVKNGRVPGIYRTWDECKAQVDGYPHAVFKGFASEAEARQFVFGTPEKTAAALRPAKANRPALDALPDPGKNGVIVYTDGSCLKNPGGPGGWAAIIKTGQQIHELSGSEPATTNNRMEMMAAIAALQFFSEPTAVTLHTDSQYLRRGFAEGWVAKWKRNGWITSTGTPVLNKELWQELDRLNSFHRIDWQWVKGHHGNPLNERCDELAGSAAIGAANKIGR